MLVSHVAITLRLVPLRLHLEAMLLQPKPVASTPVATAPLATMAACNVSPCKSALGVQIFDRVCIFRPYHTGGGRGAGHRLYKEVL